MASPLFHGGFFGVLEGRKGRDCELFRPVRFQAAARRPRRRTKTKRIPPGRQTFVRRTSGVRGPPACHSPAAAGGSPPEGGPPAGIPGGSSHPGSRRTPSCQVSSFRGSSRSKGVSARWDAPKKRAASRNQAGRSGKSNGGASRRAAFSSMGRKPGQRRKTFPSAAGQMRPASQRAWGRLPQPSKR